MSSSPAPLPGLWARLNEHLSNQLSNWLTARRERKARQVEENRLLRMWASTELVAEMRQLNATLIELVKLAQAAIAPSEQEAGRDCSPVELDELTDIEEARQQEQDEELSRFERTGEFSSATGDNNGDNNGSNKGQLDRVDDWEG